VQLAQAGIRVNAIAPGFFFLTELNRNLMLQADGFAHAAAQEGIAHTPMGRFGRFRRAAEAPGHAALAI